MTSTALLATVGNATQFKNRRQMAASLGITPMQNASGGMERLLGISKRVDAYVRTLETHYQAPTMPAYKSREAALQDTKEYFNHGC